jgi:hypothetical protein
VQEDLHRNLGERTTTENTAGTRDPGNTSLPDGKRAIKHSVTSQRVYADTILQLFREHHCMPDMVASLAGQIWSVIDDFSPYPVFATFERATTVIWRTE